jgi:hypothetical protein
MSSLPAARNADLLQACASICSRWTIRRFEQADSQHALMAAGSACRKSMSSLLARPQLLVWPLSLVRCAALAPYGPRARYAPSASRALRPADGASSISGRNATTQQGLQRDEAKDRRYFLLRGSTPEYVLADGPLICYPWLDRRKVEFSGFCHAGGLDAPAGIMREAGGLLPMAPCGRSSL